MRRQHAVILAIAGLVALLIFWIGTNTEWADVPLTTPLKGEARRNPFYAAQRFAEALGARTSASHAFDVTRSDAVVFLSSWHWDLSPSRRDALEAWVESGGRLVLDGSVTAGADDLKRWSSIGRRTVEVSAEALIKEGDYSKCRTLRESARTSSGTEPEEYSLCEFRSFSSLTHGAARPVWALEDRTGTQALRVPIGRGSVTMLNATPFGGRSLFEGDHGRLFVAATQLRSGDEVHFLTEQDHPSLLALAWDRGAPVVALALGAIAFALWRGAVRFGPLAAVPDRARRSLIEQIRGTGQFSLRHGDGAALHTAMLRALREAASRRIPGYARLSDDERFAAVAGLTGMNDSELAAAQAAGGRRGPRGMRHAIAVLEAARRRTLIEGQRSRHDTD